MSQTFRYDINGLRAIAVIAVVLFHFNPSWLPGGFAGVDVFFVISGFLMTGIIFRGLEQNNFSILKFYVARANRIIPALALLCLVLLFLGWFYLTPLEYRALGKHAASSVAFLSNIIYWREAGYFDAASHEKWLLHTWSLSVEWQFYILYPLILVAMRKFISIKVIKLLLLAGSALGFIFCAIATYKWPNPSYYLLPTRAWEMMLGGIAYIYPLTLKENRRKLIEWIGVTLIIGSYFLISSSNPWPGYLAIFPVLGSFLIIQANRNNSIITNNIIFQKLGFWSYSIYLWHWPLVVAIYVFSLNELFIYIGILLSIFLGFLSHKYVEKFNFRSFFNNLFDYLKCKPIYIAGFVGMLGVVVYLKSESFTNLRLTDEETVVINQQRKDLVEPDCQKEENGLPTGCVYGKGPIKAIVIGDSHAQAQAVAIGNRAAIFGGSILSFGTMGCPTIKGVQLISNNKVDHNCGILVEKIIKMMEKKYKDIPIIIINRTSLYLHGHNEKSNYYSAKPKLFVDKVFNDRDHEFLENITGHMVSTICEFTKNNPVYLVRPIPEMKRDVPLSMFRFLSLNNSKESIKVPLSEYQKRQSITLKMQDIAQKKCGAEVLNLNPYLCDDEYCYGDADYIPLYYDDDHLSEYGAQVVSVIYDDIFKQSYK